MPPSRAIPLKWTAITVRVLLVLFAAMMIYDVGRAALSGGENSYGSRGTQSMVCVPSPAIGNVNNLELRAAGGATGIYDDPYAVAQGVEFRQGASELCRDDPSLGVQLLYQTSRFATPLALLAALFLLDRLIKGARKEGGFNEVVVRRLWFLGVFMVASTLATSLLTTVIETGLADSMVADGIKNVWEMALFGWAFPWAFLIAGFGLVVMARVVGVGAHMRAELEGTV